MRPQLATNQEGVVESRRQVQALLIVGSRE